MFEFKILAKSSKTKARLGEFSTPHGKLLTPQLAFVATEGEIKSIPKEILPSLPVNLIIVNTFHLWVKNILVKIEAVGGIHHYANFSKPMMSDSGGFQVFSLGFGKVHRVGKLANLLPGEINQKSPRKSADNFQQSLDINNPVFITEEGAKFIFNQRKFLLTPEKSMEIQQKIGADIIFAFDECTSPLNSKIYTKKAMERTHRWVKRCIKKLKKDNKNLKIDLKTRNLKLKNLTSNSHYLSASNPQALFAIVQGGYFQDLRKISAQFMAKLDVPGFGIGGALGTTKDEVCDVLDWTIPYLPEEKPRHLLGIGKVTDIFNGVKRGVDLFDCVIPTREARHRVLYTKKGRVNLQKMKGVNNLIDKNCRCLACREKITYRQLAQLFSQKNPTAYFFATVHNIQFYTDLMKNIRQAINNQSLDELKKQYLLFLE